MLVALDRYKGSVDPAALGFILYQNPIIAVDTPDQVDVRSLAEGKEI
jgi:hypothetical protein